MYRCFMRHAKAASTGVILSLLILAGGSAAVAMKIKSQKDETVDFSRFHSYAWKIPGTPGSGSPSADPHVDKVVRKTADAELAKMGFKKLESADQSPDILLTYSVGWSSTFADEGWFMTPGWLVFDFSRTTDSAVLLLEFTDASTGKGAWFGWARQNANTPQAVEALKRSADDAVIKILKQYPKR